MCEIKFDTPFLDDIKHVSKLVQHPIHTGESPVHERVRLGALTPLWAKNHSQEKHK